MHLAASIILGLPLFLQYVEAQFPPQPEGLTVLKSKFHENVTISFKEVHTLFSPSQAHTNPPTARHLRNNLRRKVLLRLRPSSGRLPLRRQRRSPRLPHQHLLLVLRVPQGPPQRSSSDMAQRGTRCLFHDGFARGKRTLLRQPRL